MATVVGICNSALIKIGATTITSLTEGKKNANKCNEQYAKIRDQLLRDHTWNFAATRVKLAQSATTPVFEFEYAYTLPTDHIRLVSAHNNIDGTGQIVYKLEGGELLTDESDVYIRYVKREVDPNIMDPWFQECLAWQLGADIAIAITDITSKREIALDGLKTALVSAKSVDAIEDYPEPEPVSEWIGERI